VPKSSPIDEIKDSVSANIDSEVRINPVIRRNRVDQVYRSVAAASGSFVFVVMALIGVVTEGEEVRSSIAAHQATEGLIAI
jgi:hypothetical protein